MPSQLKNRKKTLGWGEFKPKQVQAKSPDRNVMLAATAAGYDIAIAGTKVTPHTALQRLAFEPVPGSSQVRLKDAVTVTITFDRNKSWVADWIKNKPEDQRSRLLLSHEQGHYDITALMARDFFIDLMQLKSQTFATRGAGAREIASLHQRYSGALHKVQEKYDWDTSHGKWTQLSFGPPRKSADQTKWEGLIKKAFTVPRKPQRAAPDGAVYKVRLLDILKQNGVQI